MRKDFIKEILVRILMIVGLVMMHLLMIYGFSGYNVDVKVEIFEISPVAIFFATLISFPFYSMLISEPISEYIAMKNLGKKSQTILRFFNGINTYYRLGNDGKIEINCNGSFWNFLFSNCFIHVDYKGYYFSIRLYDLKVHINKDLATMGMTEQQCWEFLEKICAREIASHEEGRKRAEQERKEKLENQYKAIQEVINS